MLRLSLSRVRLCNPKGCSPPGSSVRGDSPGKNTGVGYHALLQGSSQPRDQTQVSCIADRLFTIWATREAFSLVSTINWHLPWALVIYLPTSTMIKSSAAVAADLPHHLQKWGTLCFGRGGVETGRICLQIFSGADFMSPILESSHI